MPKKQPTQPTPPQTPHDLAESIAQKHKLPLKAYYIIEKTLHIILLKDSNQMAISTTWPPSGDS